LYGFILSEASLVVNEGATQQGDRPVCGGKAYIEIKNVGYGAVNPSGYRLNIKDSSLMYEIPSGSDSITPFGFHPFLFVCDPFPIERGDTVVFFDNTGGTSGPEVTLLGSGSELSTFQRRENGSYDFAEPTPDALNFEYLVMNEIADKGDGSFCEGKAYIELKNVGISPFNPANSQLKIKDSSLKYEFPNGSDDIAPNAFLVVCDPFVIAFQDTVVFLDGLGGTFEVKLPGGGSTSTTYQRIENGSYKYGGPTPDAENLEYLVVNEVAVNDEGADRDVNVCGGGSYIELKNTGKVAIDPRFKKPSIENGSGSYSFPYGGDVIGPDALFLLCNPFDIASEGTVVFLEEFRKVKLPLPRGGSASSTY
jgi:hypothetical protein